MKRGNRKGNSNQRTYFSKSRCSKAGSLWDASAVQVLEKSEMPGQTRAVGGKILLWEESLKLMGSTANSALGCTLCIPALWQQSEPGLSFLISQPLGMRKRIIENVSTILN